MKVTGETEVRSHRAFRIWIVSALLIVIAVTIQYLYYNPILPEKIATQFAFNGQPTSWMGKNGFFIFYFVEIAFVFLFFVGLGAVIKHIPVGFVNIPNKKYWFGFERRESSAQKLRVFLNWMGTGTSLFLVILMQMVMQMNADGIDQNEKGAFLVPMFVYLFFVGGWIVMLYKSFRIPARESGRDGE